MRRVVDRRRPLAARPKRCFHQLLQLPRRMAAFQGIDVIGHITRFLRFLERMKWLQKVVGIQRQQALTQRFGFLEITCAIGRIRGQHQESVAGLGFAAMIVVIRKLQI
jgi:hypothetical protein